MRFHRLTPRIATSTVCVVLGACSSSSSSSTTGTDAGLDAHMNVETGGGLDTGADVVGQPEAGGQDAGGETGSEAGVPEAGAPDAAPEAAAGPCNLSKPFGAPVRLNSANAADSLTYPTTGIWLSPDEMTAYISTVRADAGLSSGHIYVAVRTMLTDSFGPILPMPAVNGNMGYDEFPTVTANALTMIFASTRANYLQPPDLYIATRPNTVVNFGTPTLLASVDSPFLETSPTLSPDGQTLYFQSTRTNMQSDIFVATNGASGYTVVTGSSPVAAVNDPTANDGTPVISADGLTLYYSSNRAGAYQVYVATRASTSAAFGAPQAVTEVNAPAVGDRWPEYISADGCRLYGSGVLSGGGGNFSVWLATRPQ
jgi:hypothetical protein